MNGIEAIIVGAVQGFLEWLPVSSQGQTVLFMLNYLKMNIQDTISYSFFLHTGTMLAVIIKFRRDFRDVFKNITLNFKLSRFLIFATLSTTITALPLYFILKNYSLEQNSSLFTILIGSMLLITGIIMFYTKFSEDKNLAKISDRDMFLAGLAQGFAIMPGISRSGITVATLLARKINQETALYLSFLMSVPATIGILCIDFEYITRIPIDIALMMIGSSLFFGYISMDILLILAKKLPFWIFCLILGGITIILTIIFSF